MRYSVPVKYLKYRDFLPISHQLSLSTLVEGGDISLAKSISFQKTLGCNKFYFKLKGCNPTASFKDCGIVAAIAKAVENGSF